MKKMHLLPLVALSLVGASQLHSAHNKNKDMCGSTPPTTCYPDSCCRKHCLGPDNYGVNAPTCPITCNGDISITVEGFYWIAHQDGMEYAISNHVAAPGDNPTPPGTGIPVGDQLNNLIDAKFLTPNFKWDWGFRLGLAYCSPCDGWDIGVLWTWYKGKARDHVEAEFDDNTSLLPLLSAYAPLQGGVLYATDIQTDWKLELNLIDIELGRSFWTSKYLSMRPFIGIRIAYINQDYNIYHSGGSWSASTATTPDQLAYNDSSLFDNNFKGAGLRGGLNTEWNLGCGWGIYGNFALNLIYGRFSFDQDEDNREAASPHGKTKIADSDNSFRATRAAADLAMGLQWKTMFCDCDYGLMISLGWEQHLFWDQNQLWRANRIGDLFQDSASDQFNNTGENVFAQRRGDLDLNGVTLAVKFTF